MIDEARNKGRKIHLASLLGLCHLKNSELELQFQKYKGRVVLRGDIVKNDSVSYAVFTVQGSLPSQMTAANVMDNISRLPGCAGQAADAVSAKTQVKMEDAPQLLKIPKLECPEIWIRLPRHKWPKSWSSMEDPVVPLERNLYGHPLAGLVWERQYEKILLKHGWEKISNWECLFVHREKGLFLSVYEDDIKLAGKKQNIDPMWNVLNKEVDLGEPTSSFDHVYLGCAQRQCEISKDIVDNYRTMFESRISAGGVEKLPFPQNLRISSWSYDMAGHAKKCVERYCELANKTTQQLYKVSTPCIDDLHFKEEEETKSVGELSNTCVGSISSTPRIRNSKKPSSTRVRSWKHQWLLLCPVKLRKIVGAVQLAYILEADESTRLRMRKSIPHHHEDHIAGKGENSLQHYNLVHKFIPMPQAMKIPAAKAAVDKEWEKLEKFSAWNLTKVKSKKQVIDEARTKGAKVHFASLMDICHLKNAELEAKHQKYKGRVVLRGDIVKDDSGSYEVLNAIQRVLDSLSPRHVTRVSGTGKRHRLDTYK